MTTSGEEFVQKTRFFQSTLGVFQGGGCRAAAFVGAYDAAVKRGVRFTEVAGTSAGSIVAALIGAGAGPKFLLDTIGTLDFGKFAGPPTRSSKRRLWAKLISMHKLGQSLADIYYDLGLHSSEYIENWLESQLRILLPAASQPISFHDLILPTWIVAADARGERVRVWSSDSTATDSVATAVRASCSIPLYFQPVEGRYFDGGLLSNLPTFVFNRTSASDRPLSSRVLAFTLKATDAAAANQHTLLKLANTVIDGAQDLQLRIQGPVPILTIPTGDIRATDFDRMSADAVNKLVSNGREAANAFFDAELGFASDPFGIGRICYDNAEFFSAVVQQAERARDVFIAENDTDFVYSLFPTLLYWRLHKVPVKVLLKRTETADHGPYRRVLLRLLGAEVREIDQLPARAYIANATHHSSPAAVVGIAALPSPAKVTGVIYEGVVDHQAIAALHQQLNAAFEKGSSTRSAFGATLRFTSTDPLRIATGLRRVSQYSLPKIGVELKRVPLENLVSLTKFVREYKYRQIELLHSIYQSHGMSAFGPAEIALADQLQISPVTPPVVEENGGEFILIEGTTRATYLRDHGASDLECFVVKGVADALPAERVEFSRVRTVSKLLRPDERYPDFKYGRFRHIESSVRPIDSLVLQST